MREDRHGVCHAVRIPIAEPQCIPLVISRETSRHVYLDEGILTEGEQIEVEVWVRDFETNRAVEVGLEWGTGWRLLDWRPGGEVSGLIASQPTPNEVFSPQSLVIAFSTPREGADLLLGTGCFLVGEVRSELKTVPAPQTRMTGLIDADGIYHALSGRGSESVLRVYRAAGASGSAVKSFLPSAGPNPVRESLLLRFYVATAGRHL